MKPPHERPWWLRLDGFPPSAEGWLGARTREVRWDPFGPLSAAVVVLAATLSRGLAAVAGPIGAFAGGVASHTRFFTRPIQR